MRLLLRFALTLCTVTACAPNLAASPAPLSAATTIVPTSVATESAPATSEGPPQTHAMADPTALDFAADLCAAQWTNNGKDLPCPGLDVNSSPDGYVGLYDPALLNFKPGIQVILAYPAQNDYQGIFGRYPEYSVQPGDQFYTHLGCLPVVPCDVRFSLGYYDAAGSYHDDLAYWNFRGGNPIEEAFINLESLAGQSVQFVLVVRPNSGRSSAYALWIGPVILSRQPRQ